MRSDREAMRAAALLALASGILLFQLQGALAGPRSRPAVQPKPVPVRALPVTPVTLPVAPPATTLPPASLMSAAERSANWAAFRVSGKVPVRKSSSKIALRVGAAAAEPGKITIKKDAVPDSDETFHFKGDLGEFDLGDEVGLSFEDLKPGNYEVTEVKKGGWRVDHIVCGDPTAGASIQDQGRTVSIALPPGGNTTCTFVGTRAETKPGGATKGDGDGTKGEENPFGSGTGGEGVKGLPMTGFRPDWFLFAAGMFLIAGGALIRPEPFGFSLEA